MLKKLLVSTLLLTSMVSTVKAESYDDVKNIMFSQETKLTGIKPEFLLMPCTNYNERPMGVKPEVIILHHTAPFPSLAKVGYFFQDVNSRVSSHFTVGKDGLIIQSVDEKDRAWHSGPSAWLGKTNVNDYSLGIEILNDGDSKDPFTELQYNAVAKLVSYLMKKYDIPLSKVIGHRDIAIPLGRKIDPADNFDWKLVKAKIRKGLDMPQSFFGWWELPQESNEKIDTAFSLLKDNDVNKRITAFDLLITIPHKNYEKTIEDLFFKERAESKNGSDYVKARFYKFFNLDENDKYLFQAVEDISKYQTNIEDLNVELVNYLAGKNVEHLTPILMRMYVEKSTDEKLKLSIIKALGNYKDEEVKKFLLDTLDKTNNSNQKKSIVETLANYNDAMLNKNLFELFNETTSDEVKVAIIDSLRITFNMAVEEKMLKWLPSSSEKVSESIIWTLLRKDSLKGIKTIISSKSFDNYSTKIKIGIFNTIAKLKYKDAESFLITKIDTETDFYSKASISLALAKINTDKGFNKLTEVLEKEDSKNLKMVFLKSILEFTNKDFSKFITKALNSKNFPNEAKLIALAAVKEKKLTSVMPILKEFLVETRAEDLEPLIKETISYVENN